MNGSMLGFLLPVLRLDANEGPAPVDLAPVAATGLHRYPAPVELERRIARSLGVDARRVVVTTGASDALDRVCRLLLAPGRELLVPVPTFGMLARYAELARATVRGVEWWQGAFPTADYLAKRSQRTGLAAVISPNNPTGATLTRTELVTLAAALGELPLLFDHVYGEYADHDLTGIALEQSNVIVCRTFSKAWGLAACRLGFLVAAPELADRLRNAGGAYPAAGPSLAFVGQQLERGGDRMRAHVAAVRSRRSTLAATLERLGMPAPPSEANFLLADCRTDGDRAGESIWRELAALGIEVRRFSQPELAGRLRITVPDNDADLDRLTSALAAASAATGASRTAQRITSK